MCIHIGKRVGLHERVHSRFRFVREWPSSLGKWCHRFACWFNSAGVVCVCLSAVCLSVCVSVCLCVCVCVCAVRRVRARGEVRVCRSSQQSVTHGVG